MSEEKQNIQNILNKIKTEKIVPRPRWQFLIKNGAIWLAGLLALVLGAVAVAQTIFMISHNDFAGFRPHGPHFFQPWLLAIPFFWLICLLAFITLIYFNIKHTKRGYRYSLPLVLLVTVASSIILGVLFFYTGSSQRLDDALSRNAPLYDQLINPRVHFWFNPAEGRLSGLIISRPKPDAYQLIDINRGKWTVYTDQAQFRNNTIIEIGRPARFIGQAGEGNQFAATEVLPMHSGRRFFDRFKPNVPPPQIMKTELKTE